jgi:replicative DNA helicase
VPNELVVQVDVLGESIVLSAAMADPEARASLVRRLKPDRFQHPQHRAAWEAVAELERRKLEFDLETVTSLFGDKVDVRYLASLREQRPGAPPNLEHAVEGLLWDAARAEATKGPLNALLGALKDRTTAPERVKALGRQVAEALSEHRDRRYLRDGSAVVGEMLRELSNRRAGEAVYPYGVPALDLDEKTGKSRLAPGAKPGMVTIITGLSGSGKSTLAGRIALGQAMRGRRVLYGAWEMGDVITCEVLSIMLLAEKGHPVSRTRFLTGEHTEEEEALLGKAAEVVTKYVRFMDNPYDRQMGEKSSNARNLDLVHQYISDTGADVMVTDLWDRCLVEQRPEEEKRALDRTQAIAKETQCHLILLAQQRLKDVEQRDDPHPTREGIKGSSSWVDIGDTVLGVHRPAQFKAIPDDTIEVDVLKRRYGPYPMRVEVAWDPDRGWYGQGTTVPYERTTARQEGPGGEVGAFLGADGEVLDPPKGRRKGKGR